MKNNKLPLVLLTHTLPKDWLITLEGQCVLITGSENAIQWEESLLKQLPKAEGIFSLLTIPITEEIISQTQNLRVISNMAAGVDNIDITACTRRGIPVGNTPGVLTESTADLTMALLLSIARNIPQASSDAHLGLWKTWSPIGWLGKELNGSTLGIIGMGKIGKAVAKRALSFGMSILFTDLQKITYQDATQVTMEELLERSDIITLHAPLTSETSGIINKKTLALMKPSAILINAARGQLVDNSALLEALENKRISAVALDVTDPEPLPSTHPLFGFSNCLIVPHIGSATQKTRRLMAELACQNLVAGLSGKRLPHCINPEVYERIKE